MEQADIDRLRQDSIAPQKMLIDGVLRASRSEEAMDVISPIDGRVFTSIARGTRADADEAVAAARAVRLRGRHMAQHAADGAQGRAAEMGRPDRGGDTGDHGTWRSGQRHRDRHGGKSRGRFGHKDDPRYYAEAIDKIYGEVAPTPDSHLGLILREPVGVVAAIVLELSADDRRLETGAGAGGRKFGCHQAGGNGLSEPAADCPAGT